MFLAQWRSSSNRPPVWTTRRASEQSLTVVLPVHSPANLDCHLCPCPCPCLCLRVPDVFPGAGSSDDTSKTKPRGRVVVVDQDGGLSRNLSRTFHSTQSRQAAAHPASSLTRDPSTQSMKTNIFSNLKSDSPARVSLHAVARVDIVKSPRHTLDLRMDRSATHDGQSRLCGSCLSSTL